MTELEAVNARVPKRVKDAIVSEAEERGVSQSTVVREYMEGVYSGEDEDDAAPTAGATVIPATIAATLVVGLSFLAAGDTAVGGPLATVSAFAGLNWFLATLTGWDTRARELLGELRDGYAEIGGFRGFFRALWANHKDNHPVENPTTPVERAARLDLYFPVLFVEFIAFLGVAVAVVELGLLPLIGPTGAAVLLVAVVAAAYAPFVAIFISAVAVLAISSARGDDVVEDGSPDV
jgi:hypothetical protein